MNRTYYVKAKRNGGVTLGSMFRSAWPLANRGPGKAFSAQPCDSIVTRKGKPLTPCEIGPGAAALQLRGAMQGQQYNSSIQLSVLVLFAGMLGLLTWGPSRLAVPSRGARDLEGQLRNAREGSKPSGCCQFETLVLADRGDKLRRTNISRRLLVADVST